MWKNVLKISCSLSVLAVIFWHVDIKAFIDNLVKISLWAVLGVLFSLVVQSLFVSLRWQWIIKKYDKNMAYSHVLKMNYLSLSASLLLPGVIADPAVKSLLMKKYHFTLKDSLSTVILDKIFVLTGLFMMTLFATPIIAAVYGQGQHLLVAYLLVLSALPLAWLVYLLRDFLPLKSLFRSENKYAQFFIEVLRPLMFDENLMVKCLALTVLSQVLCITGLYVLSLFMPLEIKYYECLLLMTPALLMAALPISLNGWGVRELSIIYMLGLIAVPAELALALSVQYGLIGVLLRIISLLSWLPYKR